MDGTDGAPSDLGDGWPVCRPEQENLDANRLRGLAPQFETWTDINIHAALIVRHGKLVYERYFRGEDQAWATALGSVRYDPSMRHDLRSITKSITSLLVGIAIDRGWLQNLDEPVFTFFPEHADLRTPEKEFITLRHLLTMSAGFAWSEFLPYSNPANSERRMIEAPDQCRYVLEQPIARPPGVTYNYNGGLTALLAAILQKVSGRPVDDIARDALFEPLGITDIEWIRYNDGTPMVASGLRMRPRDLAKIGQVVAGGGVWSDRRIVSRSWIEQSTSPQIQGEALFFYGYQWWLGRSLIDRREVTWISAVGYGGQRLYIVPSLDLVVLVMAGLYDEPVLQSIVGEVVLRRYALPAAMIRAT